MSSQNAKRNFQNVQYNGTTLTGVKDIRISDATSRIQDGSDNDTQFTLNVLGPKKTGVTLVCRSYPGANVCATAAPHNLTWSEEDVTNASSLTSHTVENVIFGQGGVSGGWGELRTYEVAGEGGSWT